MEKTTEERFWEKVKKTDGCWEWQGCKGGSSYGLFWSEGKKIYAHRYSYLLHNGKLPKKMVLHKCDNRICVNPDHLFPGDARDNLLDAIQKGRYDLAAFLEHKKLLIGEKHSRSKLTEKQVLQIRVQCSKKEASIQDIALQYSVDESLIRQIKKRLIWRHI